MMRLPIGMVIASVIVFHVGAGQSDQDTLSHLRTVLSVSYGIASSAPDGKNIASHTANDGSSLNTNQFSQTGTTVRPIDEIVLTCTMRPSDDPKIVLLRAGRIQCAYHYSVNMDETAGSSVRVGDVTYERNEQYTVYPFSVGVGLSTKRSEFELHGEFMYALAMVTEGTTITTPEEAFSLPSKIYRTSGVGTSAAAQFNLVMGPTASMRFEAGYRYLSFDEFKDPDTNSSTGLDFTTSGYFLTIGVGYGF